jgi:hypothetical protein
LLASFVLFCARVALLAYFDFYLSRSGCCAP